MNATEPFFLKAAQLETQLGPMMAVSDDDGLYLLEFVDKHGLERELERFKFRTKADIVLGTTGPIKSITLELKAYFDGLLTEFKTSLHVLGSPFQKLAWEALMRIPYGQTRTYAAQSEAIGKPSAYRAVANANGANRMAIVIPCHRVINTNGALGGYSAGLARKQWLIDHERSLFQR